MWEIICVTYLKQLGVCATIKTGGNFQRNKTIKFQYLGKGKGNVTHLKTLCDNLQVLHHCVHSDFVFSTRIPL
jgi:hypothetical protein